MKTIHFFASAILFYKNKLTSGCMKQETRAPRQHKFIAMQFTDNNCDRHTLKSPLLKDGHTFLKEN